MVSKQLLVMTGAIVMSVTGLPRGVLGQATEKTVPVFEEPRHHLIVDTPPLRILDIQIPPGDTTLFHVHSSPMLYVPIASSRTRNQDLGQDWSGGAAAATPPAATLAPTRPGRVTSPAGYVEKGQTHRVNNMGATVFRLIGIANRTAGATADSDDVSGLSTTPELVNRWYRAHRVALGPGEATPAHRHATPVVVVMQTQGSASSTDDTAWSPLNGPGDIARSDGAGAHVVRNTGPGAIELVEIEVRGATPR